MRIRLSKSDKLDPKSAKTSAKSLKDIFFHILIQNPSSLLSFETAVVVLGLAGKLCVPRQSYQNTYCLLEVHISPSLLICEIYSHQNIFLCEISTLRYVDVGKDLSQP